MVCLDQWWCREPQGTTERWWCRKAFGWLKKPPGRWLVNRCYISYCWIKKNVEFFCVSQDFCMTQVGKICFCFHEQYSFKDWFGGVPCWDWNYHGKQTRRSRWHLRSFDMVRCPFFFRDGAWIVVMFPSNKTISEPLAWRVHVEQLRQKMLLGLEWFRVVMRKNRQEQTSQDMKKVPVWTENRFLMGYYDIRSFVRIQLRLKLGHMGEIFRVIIIIYIYI